MSCPPGIAHSYTTLVTLSAFFFCHVFFTWFNLDHTSDLMTVLRERRSHMLVSVFTSYSVLEVVVVASLN